MLCTIISAVMLVTRCVIGPEQPNGGPGKIPPPSSPVRVAARAHATAIAPDYLRRCQKMPDTADAHVELGTWCVRLGFKAEAAAHFVAALELDPGHEGAWLGLGFKHHNGGWPRAEQRIAYAHEANAQRKADGKWKPLLKQWKSWLGEDANREKAEDCLTMVTDPQAVPAICSVFGGGRAPDQKLAVQLLGQVQSPASSRRLALLAVSGVSAEVRRAAVETLRWRDPLEFADLLIGLLRDPIKYHIRSVRGPGLPGSLTVSGASVNLERVYTPPPPPNISIMPGDHFTLDSRGLPTIFRHTDETDLPFVWLCKGYMFPSGAIIPPHVGVQIQLGEMWVENWKTAHSAQRQLGADAAAIEFANDLQRAANEQIVDVLSQCVRERLPVDREACRRWWFKRLGQTPIVPAKPLPLTVAETVNLDYLPHNVGGLGFDPIAGYFVIVPVNW
jgi:hypothetical protein